MICVALFIITSVLYFVFKKNKSPVSVFGVAVYFTLIAFGNFIAIANEDLHNQNHFFNFLDENQQEKTITFRVSELLKPNAFSQRYYVEILKIDHNKTEGKVLINIEKDSLKTFLPIDGIYLTKLPLVEVNAPLNPDQFSYKNYLEKQQVHYQLYAKKTTIKLLKDETHTLSGYAANFRNLINQKLNAYHYTNDQLSIINALILGQRQHITKDLYDSYTNAGAIHILAVSGLHVGIILLILNLLFKPIERLKHGKTVKTLILLVLLWTYALIAGGSASIIRATTMFSIVAVGMNLKRPTNIYNTLAISVFVLLLIKPNFLYDVGFQLSYAAVIAIVSFQPILQRIWTPKYKLPNLLWQTLTVTVAAQFGIIPISLYYFHQFPSLFWLSNLVVIPLLGLILGLGLLVIVLALLNSLPSFLANLFGTIINWMNQFFGWIANQERFLILDIPFTILQVVVSYLLIFSIYKLFTVKHYKWLRLSLIFIIGLQVTYIFNTIETKGDKFMVFHKNRTTLIGKQHNNKLALFSSLKAAERNTIIRSYTVKNALTVSKSDSISSLYKLKNQHLLVVDSLGVFNVKNIKIDYVLLTQSPKLNLTRLIDSLKPKTIIADGNNYKSYIKRWSKTCKKQKLPLYQTGKTGAFILEY